RRRCRLVLLFLDLSKDLRNYDPEVPMVTEVLSAPFEKSFDGRRTKKRAGGQRVSGSLRSRADSNRCTSFCRALPSHSATRPVDASKSVSLDEAQNYKI